MKKMVSVSEALNLVLEFTPVTPASSQRSVNVESSLGLTLAQDLISDRQYPPFDRAAMDGVAVKMKDAGCQVRIVGEVAAGKSWKDLLAEGECVEIMTGAPCPEHTETVVPKEFISRKGFLAQLPSNMHPDQHIVRKGTECRKGEIVALQGTVITPLIIANLLSFGYRKIKVNYSPSIGIVTTGDEINFPGDELREASIRDSNGGMLAALCKAAGVLEVSQTHAGDIQEEIKAAIGRFQDRQILLFIGGVSEGKYDMVPSVLSECGADIIFHKIRQKPGKPLLFARNSSQLIFGLPGNPLSVHFCFQRYVWTAIRRWMGLEFLRSKYSGILSSDFSVSGDRPCFVLVQVNKNDGQWSLKPCQTKGSADIFSSCRANGYIFVQEGTCQWKKGDTVEFEFFDEVMR